MFPIAAALAVGKWIWGASTKVLGSYMDNRAKVQDAELQVKLKELDAKQELAVWKIKSDMEWDLKWADGAQHSWKDEYLLILWSIPLIGLFVPGLRAYIQEGFSFLKQLDPDAAAWYMEGWAVIFAASFGLRAAASFMAPKSLQTAISAIASAPNDVPDAAVSDIEKRLAEAKGDDDQ